MTIREKLPKFISKGGTTVAKKHKRAVQAVNLKIPLEMLTRIDSAVSKKKVPTYRIQWMLEAFIEKLEREKA